MKPRHRKLIVPLAMLLTFLLVAGRCGDPPPNNAAVWDEATWDEAEWQ